jgi:hypothetical protein
MMSHGLPPAFAAALNEQLRQFTSEETTVRYIDLMEYDEKERDQLRWRWERRLRNMRAAGPDCGYTRALDVALIALRSTRPDEQLFSWSAKTSTGFISGISTLLRPILILTSDHDHNSTME